MRLFYAFLLTILLAFNIPAFAPKEDLSNEIKVSKHQSFEEEFVPGTLLHFPNGKTFTIDKFLGTGNTTMVYAIREYKNKVLRLPRRARKHLEPKKFLDQMMESAQLLKEEKIPHTQIFDSLQGLYVLAEKIPEGAISFEAFLFDQSIPKKNRDRMEESLFRQVRNFSHLVNGDLGGKQMSYWPDKEEWVLNDWVRFGYRPVGAATTKMAKEHSETFFEDIEFPDGYRKEEYKWAAAYVDKLEERYWKTLNLSFKNLLNKNFERKQEKKAKNLPSSCQIIMVKINGEILWQWKGK